MQSNSISLTPAIICELISLAHLRGWDPDASKSNSELHATVETVRDIGKKLAIDFFASETP
jgi:hypothetical protein